MKRTAFFGKCLGVAVLAAGIQLSTITVSADTTLINVDFGEGLAGSAKVGPAAVGQSASDFWNFYSRDDGASNWRRFGVVSNLKGADGTTTTAGLTVANAPGSWGNASSDAMYVGYVYPFNGGNVTVTLMNLAAGQYDFYLYANDGKDQLVVGGVDYGVKTSLDTATAGIPVWQEGVHYVRYQNVPVSAGQAVVITVRPGVYGYAIISGMQVVKTAELPPPPPAFLVNVDFGEGLAGSAKVGLAATGQSANDFWNFYTRDDGAGHWRTFGVVSNLKTADGTTTTAGLTVANAPGSWGNGSSDAMYVGYLYPFNGGNVTLTLTNLAAGQYDFYLYANDGKDQLVVDAVDYGVKTCLDTGTAGIPVWEEGVQYVRYPNVPVSAGRAVVITVRPGVYGYAIISGMQVARVGAPVAVSPALVTQPTSQTVFAGTDVTFSASAIGTDPLSFQWRRNGTNIAGATGTSLALNSVQVTDAGSYSVQVTNASGIATSTNAALVVVQFASNTLVNIDFGEGLAGSAKVGLAATGQSANDFWNFYTRDDGAGHWRTFGVVSNLKTADGTVTAAGLTVANAPGSWGNASSDAMYVGYLYPFNGGNVTLTLTNLAAGQYDFYLYASDGNDQLVVGGVDYGVKPSLEPAPTGVPVWQEGVQYVRYRNVPVSAGQTVVISIRPGVYGYAIISGMQVVKIAELPPSPPAFLMNIDVGAGLSGSAKVGPAAAGQNTNDFWNFYTRDDGAGHYRTFGVVSNLKTADGTPTAAGLTVANAPGSWGNGSSDPMYGGYDYPFNGGNVTLMLTNLAAGQYDFYLYANDGKDQLAVSGVDYGVKTCLDPAPAGVPMWQEGVQYVRYQNVPVSAGQAVAITVRPGVYGYAIISGMQIAGVGAPPGVPPVLLTQPVSQTVFAGTDVTFTASASGTGLNYQWRRNGTNIPGETGTSLVRSGVQASDAGYYSVRVTNGFGSPTSTNAALVVVQYASNALLNVDIGAGLAGSAKVGLAAVGQSANDFWNFYTRDDGAGHWRTLGTVSNLKSADGTVTAAGLTVANAPGSWGNGSSDPMYAGYDYPFNGGNVTLTLTNLAAGQYDFYLYANDGNNQLAVGGMDYGIKTCLDAMLVSPPVWQEGVQYVRYQNAPVSTGQAVVFTVRPGVYGYSIISGMQIAAVNLRPVAYPQSVTVNEDGSVAVTLSASDADGDALTFSIVTAPAHGALSGTAPNLTYTPNPNYFGPDEFTFKANDGLGDSEIAKVSLSVLPVNDAPVARIVVAPLAELPGVMNLMVIAPVCAPAKVVLDGSRSSDVENDSLQYVWTEGTNELAVGIMVTNLFAPGSHTITLTVNDGLAEASAAVTIEVLTPARAVAVLEDLVRNAQLNPWSKIPLLAILHAASGAFERCHALVGFQELMVFQQLVRAEVAPQDPALAEALRHGAQEIMDSLRESYAGGQPPCRFTTMVRQANGHAWMQFDAPQSAVYRVEASTNFVDWETIGVAARQADGAFEFEDVNAGHYPSRFYRIVSP